MVPLTCDDCTCPQQNAWNESEHDRTGGPNPHKTWINWAAAGIEFTEEESLGFTESGSIGVSLQEQVEQVEDALGKALTVIEAFVEQEKDLRTQVYQAQLDAQDWQNKYNEAAKYRTLSDELISGLMTSVSEAETKYVNHTDGYKDDIGRLEGLLYDEKQKAKDLLNALEMTSIEGTEIVGELKARVGELTEQNTQLELRNERQAKRGEHARQVIAGVWDHTLKF